MVSLATLKISSYYPIIMRFITNNVLTYVFFLLLSSPLSLLATGDPIAGKSKAMICSACHGETGISANPLWPNLAGQHARYLLEQLRQFKSGNKRPSPIMSPMVASLTEQDMEDLAIYYAQQPEAAAIKTQPPHTVGEQLFRQGDSLRHIAACIACHGPDGRGNAQAGFPLISHQNADYTVQQLMAFKAKSRQSDPLEIMRTLASKLNPEDMKQVADYIAGLE